MESSISEILCPSRAKRCRHGSTAWQDRTLCPTGLYTLVLHSAFNLFSCEIALLAGVCSGRIVSTGVVPSPVVKVADALQRDVDHKLLVSSKSKGPTARRQYPSQKKPTAKVRVLTILLVHVVGASMLTLCAHQHSVQIPSASQPPPLEYEHAGGKRNRSASPTVATLTRPPRRQCCQPPPGKR